MKIFINYKTTDGPWGGVNSFAKNLKKFLTEHSKETIKAPQPYMDIFLVLAASSGQNSVIDLKQVRRLLKKRENWINKFTKRYQFKLVHRLDGLRATYAGEFIENDQLQLDISKLSDYTIFQSKASLEAFKKFGYSSDKYSIIYNGADQSVFYPSEKKRDGKFKILSVSWSDNVNKGFNTIAAISKIKGVTVTFVGRWNKTVNKENVILLGEKKHTELAKIMRENDVFLHAAENDPCPNVVLEALSSGLPILYHKSGGTEELAQKYGVALPKLSSASALVKTVDLIKNDFTHYKSTVLKDLYWFSIERAGKEYLKVFEELTLVR